jgi:hypothetical protein
MSGARRRGSQVRLLVLVMAAAFLGIHLLWQFYVAPVAEGQELVTPLPAFVLLTLFRFILIVGICSSLAMGWSGGFLADIFELTDVRVAWDFIRNLAFGGSNEILHLRDGKIAEEDRESTLVLIGGPGRVQAAFDTAALFEKPDGTPHVVAAAHNDGSGNSSPQEESLLEGFERLREPIIDLRDQYLGSLSGESMTVTGRSLDGMPIGVTDVRGVYSVRRSSSAESSGASLRNPYPVRERDVEDLIYRQSVPVLTEEGYPSGLPGDWSDIMLDLIRGSLRDFMSENQLSEYLAGVGTQEIEVTQLREDEILSRTVQISREAVAAGPAAEASKSRFHPRTELTRKFRKYGSEFSTKAQEHGLELHWIGVGTWKMPDESIGAIVDDKHLEAWRVNRENAQRSDPRTLEQVTEEALLDEKLRLVRAVPIASHEKNQTRYSDKNVLLDCLLQNFWEQLGDALDLMYNNGTRTAELDGLEEAMARVEELLGIRQVGHILGDGSISRIRPRAGSPAKQEGPPAPASRAEAAKYQTLLGKLQGDYKVAEAMIANEARRHSALSREDLITRIVQRFERHGR